MEEEEIKKIIEDKFIDYCPPYCCPTETTLTNMILEIIEEVDISQKDGKVSQ